MTKKKIAPKKISTKRTKRASLVIQNQPAISTSKFIWVGIGVLALIAAVSRFLPVSSTQKLNSDQVVPTPTSFVKSASNSAEVKTATPSGLVVRVRKGDTFGRLAVKYCGTTKKAEELQTANGFSDPRLLKENDRVIITCAK